MNFEERTLNVVCVLTENIVVNITTKDTDFFDVYAHWTGTTANGV